MKTLLLAVLIFLPFSLLAQEKMGYSIEREKIEFAVSPDEYYVESSASSIKDAVRTISTRAIMNINNNAAVITLNLSGTNYDIRKSELKAKSGNLLKRIEPVLVFRDNTKQICTGEVIIKFTDENYLSVLSASYDITVNVDEFVKKQYLIKFNGLNTAQIFLLLNQLNQNKQIEFAEPNFIRLLKPSTSDPAFSSQWAIKNQGYLGGTSGADMRVEDAWSMATGTGIKVAVIDEGVDLTHPDLAANLLSGYDATGNGSNGAPNTSTDDGHGTSCAGIIAAVANNSIGTAGIAYNAKVIPVRIAYSNGLPLGNPGRGWISSDSWIASGITWAKNNGADILSNSWGGGSPSSTITNAINDAVNNGRSGKGCIVLFATGNDNLSSVSYPASLSNVIAVGASSMCDERKSPSSCDGEFWWGGNYGTGLDVMAPGVEIYATDIAGTSGYSSGDYTSSFNGTSAATPNVAGVMALVLSMNSNLTAQQARNILETSCDKVGGYTYQSNVSGQPNGTWTSNAGYGRVNACAALIKSLSITGPSSFCSSAVYSLSPAPPAGSTIYWSANPSYIAGLVPSGSQVTAYANNPGTFNLTATVVINGTTSSTTLNNIAAGITGWSGSVWTSADQSVVLKSWAQTEYNYICQNTTAYFHLDGATSGSQFNYIGNLSSAPTFNGWDMVFTMDPGSYATFGVTITQGGCTQTIWFTFVAMECPWLNNYRGVNEADTAKSIMEKVSMPNEKYGFRIAPNPVSSELIIYGTNEPGSTGGIQRVVISDLYGKKVIEQEYKTGTSKTVLNVSKLRPALYVAAVFDGKKWISMKFIKH